ncbi:aromatic acid exporter family protein [Janibacter sp. GXQ6167]|uniref:FUSC family protein n=1 Tax=Janibacter sp. GXQ6167 TaxID=3240791 RepID=UPI003523C605
MRAEVAVLRPKAPWRVRLRRLRARSSRILTAAFGAAIAWWIARDVLSHPQPFFAPVTVVVCLGLTYGQRIQRVAELVVGVAVGVLVGDLFVAVVGSGVWQIAVIASVAMAIATVVGAGPLLTVQAGVQSIIVTTLVAQPEQAFSRWLDAVVGGVVALILAMAAPGSPVRQPRREAAEVVAEVADILRECAAALVDLDPVAADRTLARARASEDLLTQLKQAANEGLSVVALSPLHARSRPEVRAIAGLLEPLDRSVRNLRVLARRVDILVRDGQRVPEEYIELLESLADVVSALAEELRDQQVPDLARDGLIEVAETSAIGVQGTTISAEVLRAQVRSMVVDLLMLTGLTHAETVAIVPPEQPPRAPRSEHS